MTQFNFNANREEVAKTYNLGKGEYYKVKDGDNRVRLVSVCLPHQSDYKGKPTFKWLCQVLDLKDGKVKPYFMPDGVYRQLIDLQMEDGFEFTEVPMPYNINIKTTNAGDITAKYQIMGSPKRIELTPEQLKAIADAPTVEEVQTKIRENEKTPAEVTTKEQAAEQMQGEVDTSDIPF